MTIYIDDLTVVGAALAFFVGTYFMLASFEEHKAGGKRTSVVFYYVSMGAYILGGIMLAVGT